MFDDERATKFIQSLRLEFPGIETTKSITHGILNSARPRRFFYILQRGDNISIAITHFSSNDFRQIAESIGGFPPDGNIAYQGAIANPNQPRDLIEYLYGKAPHKSACEVILRSAREQDNDTPQLNSLFGEDFIDFVDRATLATLVTLRTGRSRITTSKRAIEDFGEDLLGAIIRVTSQTMLSESRSILSKGNDFHLQTKLALDAAYTDSDERRFGKDVMDMISLRCKRLYDAAQPYLINTIHN